MYISDPITTAVLVILVAAYIYRGVSIREKR
jgi:hypothetical protein